MRKPKEPLDIRPQEENANLHTERGMAALEGSMQSDGWIGAVTVAADGEAFDGSARLEKSEAIGLTDTIVIHHDGTKRVVLVRDDIPTAQDPRAVRLGVAANRIPQINLNYDRELLGQLAERGHVKLDDYFSQRELVQFMAAAHSRDGSQEPGQGGDEFDDDADIRQDRVRVGDLWQIGPHRLFCGDAGNPENVALLLDRQADLLVTSPPYGVGKEYENWDLGDWARTIEQVFRASALVAPLWFVNLANRRTGNEGFEAHTFGMMNEIFSRFEYLLLSLRIWSKPPAWLRTPYWRHTYKEVDDYEFLAIFCRADEKPPHLNRLTDEENNAWGYRGVWEFGSVAEHKEHKATFPIELPTRAIRMLTDKGDAVYDPMVGTGTTIVAAHRLERYCYAMDLSPEYCDLSLKRAEAEGITPITLISRANQRPVSAGVLEATSG